MGYLRTYQARTFGFQHAARIRGRLVAGRLQGDPFLGALIGGGLLKKAAGFVGGKILGSGVGRAVAARVGSIARSVGGIRLPGALSSGASQAIIGGATAAGVGALIQRAGGGGRGGREAGEGGRRRRMNVTNVRALRRSIRRVQGFSKLARSTFTLERQVRLKRKKGR